MDALFFVCACVCGVFGPACVLKRLPEDIILIRAKKYINNIFLKLKLLLR